MVRSYIILLILAVVLTLVGFFGPKWFDRF